MTDTAVIAGMGTAFTVVPRYTVTELTVDADDRAVIFVSRDSRDTNRSSFIGDYGGTCKNVFQHHYNIGVKPIHPFVIVCFEVFHCEIHGMVPLLQIIMLPFCRLWKWGWGWGQLYTGMDGDGDDLETSCGDMGVDLD